MINRIKCLRSIAFIAIGIQFRLSSSFSFSPVPIPIPATMSLTNKNNAAINPIIVGGGISGLATALALQNICNITSFKVLEQSSHESFLKDDGIGAGVQLGPNGLKALRFIGGEELMQKVIQVGAKLEGNALVIPGKGGIDQPMFMPDTGMSQIFVRWSVLRSILRDLIPEENIVTNIGEDVTGYQVTGDGCVELIDQSGSVVYPLDDSTRTSSSSSSHSSHSLIIGADGVSSICRYLVQTNLQQIPSEEINTATTRDVKDTGRINIKAVVPKKLGSSFKAGYTYAYFAANGGIGCFAGPAGKDHTYWAISIADEKDEECESGSESGEIQMKQFLAGVTDLNEVKLALLSKLASLECADCQFIMDMIDVTDPETIYMARSKEALQIGPHLATDDGKIVLVGDAAHAMSGSYGQNPSFGLEGAAELAVCIRDSDCIETALERYSRIRVGRCIEMQKRSAERAEKAMKGEQGLEDVSKWIHEWDIDVSNPSESDQATSL